MEQLLVALLAVATALFTSGVAGSVLHGVAGGPPYPHLIPYEVAYTNVHSPLVLSQLHGLSIDEALTAARNNEALATAGNGHDHAPAPVVENTENQIDNKKFITQEQLYEQIFGSPSATSSDGNNAIEDRPTSVGVPSQQSESSVSGAQGPQTGLEASSVQGPLPEAITVKNAGEVYINAKEGQVQMQASLVSDKKELTVSVGDIPKLPELPASSITNGSKPHGGGVANVNVNVNVNVNGDGTGSVINSTSVADITAPIKTGSHKKCD